MANRWGVYYYVRPLEGAVASITPSGWSLDDEFPAGTTLTGSIELIQDSSCQRDYAITGCKITHADGTTESISGTSFSFVTKSGAYDWDSTRIDIMVRARRHRIYIDSLYWFNSLKITADGVEYDPDTTYFDETSRSMAITGSFTKKEIFDKYYYTRLHAAATEIDIGYSVNTNFAVNQSTWHDGSVSDGLLDDLCILVDAHDVSSQNIDVLLKTGTAYADVVNGVVSGVDEEGWHICPNEGLTPSPEHEPRLFDGMTYYLSSTPMQGLEARLYKFGRWEKADSEVDYENKNWHTISYSPNFTYVHHARKVETFGDRIYLNPIWVRRRNCSFTYSVNDPSCGSVEVSRGPDYENPRAWLEGEVTFVCTANTGYVPSRIVLRDADFGSNGGVLTPVIGVDGKYRAAFDLNYNCEAEVVFEPIPRRAKVSVDTPSRKANAGTASVSINGARGTLGKDGDTAVFTASANSGFVFVGWYTPSGTLVSSSSSYSIILSQNVELVAKFGVTIHVETACSQTAHGSVMIDSSTSTSSIDKVVIVGDSVYIGAFPATDGTDYFAYWFKTSDTTFRHCYKSDQDFYITARENLSLKARFVTEADFVYVCVCAAKNSQVIAIESTITLAPEDNPSDVLEEISGSLFKEKTGYIRDLPEFSKCYRLMGGTGMTACCVPSVVTNIAMRDTSSFGWRVLPINGASFTKVASEFAASIYISENCFLYACFYESYSISSKHVRSGELLIRLGDNTNNGSGEITQYSRPSASMARANCVVCKASPTNGHSFGGWYLDANCTIPVPTIYNPIIDVYYTYLSAEYVLPSISQTTLYARTVVDENAIFAWEGSSDNKRMRWTSKTYVSSRPFDVVSARVDADGYLTGDGLIVSSSMYSSPDATQDADDVRNTNIANQDSVRIERGRPERYLQVTIENNDAVNAVFIGTNAKDLGV